MKRRYKILIGVAIAIVVALGIHFGGRWLIDTLIAMHS
jgi:hypothetical protein